jgi:hypothetical protein
MSDAICIHSTSLCAAFSGVRAIDRRSWLSRDYDSKVYISTDKTEITYEEFVRKELIHFSFADNQRSIPSVIDGLKPSQRKVLFGCFKKNQDSEAKVVQLAGYIAENTCYHHGEQSLHATIVNMAQDYVGSNNVPLLAAGGQFGTRAQVRHSESILSKGATLLHCCLSLHNWLNAVYMGESKPVKRKAARITDHILSLTDMPPHSPHPPSHPLL